jgi:hypothetical protein
VGIEGEEDVGYRGREIKEAMVTAHRTQCIH